MITRILNPSQTRSFFLFGPRQTGKSTFVKRLLTPDDLYINLLLQRTYLSYTRSPDIFRQELLAHLQHTPKFTCIVDEVQKIPRLLDEVHDFIETYNIRFILTGSSARKLKRGGANLLAGRANTYSLHPLLVEELQQDFQLERALQRGLLPYLWSSALSKTDEEEFLRAYTETYLKEEIQAEGVIRNITPFVHFLEIAANNDGEIVNFSNVARECGVSVKTAQEYYQILGDTFIAYRLEPWMKSIRKRLVAHPRYYFFDMGITNALCYHYGLLNPEIRGRRFEQFIILQLIALNAYYRLGWQFFFWRTQTGIEIDLIIAREHKPIAAIEIKSLDVISGKNLYGLKSFKQEYPDISCFVVCTTERPRQEESGIRILPWQDFFKEIVALV